MGACFSAHSLLGPIVTDFLTMWVQVADHFSIDSKCFQEVLQLHTMTFDAMSANMANNSGFEVALYISVLINYIKNPIDAPNDFSNTFASIIKNSKCVDQEAQDRWIVALEEFPKRFKEMETAVESCPQDGEDMEFLQKVMEEFTMKHLKRSDVNEEEEYENQDQDQENDETNNSNSSNENIIRGEEYFADEYDDTDDSFSDDDSDDWSSLEDQTDEQQEQSLPQTDVSNLSLSD